MSFLVLLSSNKLKFKSLENHLTTVCKFDILPMEDELSTELLLFFFFQKKEGEYPSRFSFSRFRKKSKKYRKINSVLSKLYYRISLLKGLLQGLFNGPT